MSLEELKHEIKERAEIADVIQQFVELKRAGRNLKGLCPFHNEKTPSFNVFPDQNSFYCFGCQKGGDAIHFVMEHEGLDFVAALKFLAEFLNIDPEPYLKGGIDQEKSKKKRTERDLLLQIHEVVNDYYQRCLYSDIGKQALDYCYSRGLNDETIKLFQIGYAPNSFDTIKKLAIHKGFPLEKMLLSGLLSIKNENDSLDRAYDRFRHRIIFPVWDPQGRVIAFSGRVLDKNQPGGKYVNSPETPLYTKGNVLYALPLARKGIKDSRNCVVCEGQMDVIACHNAGISNAVAPGGTAFTPEQAKLLKRYTDHVVMAFDSDQAGIKANMKSADALLPLNFKVDVCQFSEGDDPDSILKRGGVSLLKDHFENCLDYFDFAVDVLQKQEGTSPQGKAKAVTLLVGKLKLIDNQIARSEYINKVAARFSISADLIFDELKKSLLQDQRRASYKNPLATSKDTSTQKMKPRNFSAKPPKQQFNSSEPPPFPAEVEFSQNDESFEALEGHYEEKYVDPSIEFNAKSLLPGVPESVINAEADLIDLCLHNQYFAEKLNNELELERISSTPTGEVLNDLLAYTAQGEWALLSEVFSEKVGEYSSAHLAIALFEPSFKEVEDEDRLQLCYDGCMSMISIHYLQIKMDELTAEIKSLPDGDEKREKRRTFYKMSAEFKDLQNKRIRN
ncbi:MAG: DNA primase [Lentisphaeria bacterium]|nr:DNA primase [Lentisphaeria bacterium]